jgi:hypothetical protein
MIAASPLRENFKGRPQGNVTPNVMRMNCTILILAPKLREAMRKFGRSVSFELLDLVLVEVLERRSLL